MYIIRKGREASDCCILPSTENARFPRESHALFFVTPLFFVTATMIISETTVMVPTFIRFDYIRSSLINNCLIEKCY